MSEAAFSNEEPGIEIPDDVGINAWGPKGAHRTCAECGRDCFPEPVETGGHFTIAFICREHGILSVVDPFEDQRQEKIRLSSFRLDNDYS